jgi:hypothetical protein
LNPAASLLDERDSPLNRLDLDRSDRGGPFAALGRKGPEDGANGFMDRSLRSVS